MRHRVAHPRPRAAGRRHHATQVLLRPAPADCESDGAARLGRAAASRRRPGFRGTSPTEPDAGDCLDDDVREQQRRAVAARDLRSRVRGIVRGARPADLPSAGQVPPAPPPRRTSAHAHTTRSPTRAPTHRVERRRRLRSPPWFPRRRKAQRLMDARRQVGLLRFGLRPRDAVRSAPADGGEECEREVAWSAHADQSSRLASAGILRLRRRTGETPIGWAQCELGRHGAGCAARRKAGATVMELRIDLSWPERVSSDVRSRGGRSQSTIQTRRSARPRSRWLRYS